MEIIPIHLNILSSHIYEVYSFTPEQKTQLENYIHNLRQMADGELPYDAEYLYQIQGYLIFGPQQNLPIEIKQLLWFAAGGIEDAIDDHERTPADWGFWQRDIRWVADKLQEAIEKS